MIFLLFPSAFSVIHDYNTSLYSYLSPEKTYTLGFFYKSETPNLDEKKMIMNMVDKYIEGINILSVNCSEFDSLCSHRYIDIFPTIALFRPNNQEKILMSLEFSLYSIVDFAVSKGNARSLLPPSKVQKITSHNYSTFLNSATYKVIEYIDHPDRSSDMLLISFEELSFIFSEEIEIKFGKVNCSEDIDFCFDVGTSSIPIVRLYHEDKHYLYEGTREVPYLVDFINYHCKTHRSINRSYSFVFDATLENIVSDFMKKTNKQQYIDQMIKYSDAFVVTMKRIQENGEKALFDQKENLMRLYNDPYVKGKAKENVAGKLEMLSVFEKYLPYIPENSEL
ncbi:hypothetical protein TRFO_16620 [Tritrichomonas foetus]|uniref:Thioredoxin domain-containing protein n=1 Tax=Tritrichomonas foetus TaxID=1144522 RepID=A0A1J4KUV2_9EUKA|nr:hypothetical protein TRFO_16620 [Tritrichomonas foetus]|eukprot:OHT13293.1 hypothetical protein TRFO_16620 [Tritrichomonas foetus]